jgi:hypothetical protein
LILDILDGGDETFFGCIFFIALPFRTLGNPPSGVGAEFVLRYEPGAAQLVVLGTFLLDGCDPFFKRAAGFGFEVLDPFLNHGYTGMNVIERRGSGGGAGHESLPMSARRVERGRVTNAGCSRKAI